MILRAYLISSTGISSHSELLFVLILAISFWISSTMNGIKIFVGGIGSHMLFIIKSLLKYSTTILLCSVGLVVRPSFPLIYSIWGGFRYLFFFATAYILVLSFCMFSGLSMVFLTFSFSSALILWISARILGLNTVFNNTVEIKRVCRFLRFLNKTHDIFSSLRQHFYSFSWVFFCQWAESDCLLSEQFHFYVYL